MCGRYQAWVDDDELIRIIEREKRGNAVRYFQRSEVFPGSILPVIYGSYANVRAHLSTWGYPLDRKYDNGEQEITYIDSENSQKSSKSVRGFLINARAETAASKPMFRGAMLNNSPDERRIIVLTSGYYEWKNVPGSDGKTRKIRCHIRPQRDGDALLLAGLESSTGKNEHRHVILTTAALGSPAEIHDRMPLFLRREEIRPWLYDTDFALAKLKERIPCDLLLRQAE